MANRLISSKAGLQRYEGPTETMLKVDLIKNVSLTTKLLPDGFSHAATEFVELLKINSIKEQKRQHRWVVVKRRNVYGGRGANLINFYFRLAQIPIRFVSDVRTWCRWE